LRRLSAVARGRARRGNERWRCSACCAVRSHVDPAISLAVVRVAQERTGNSLSRRDQGLRELRRSTSSLWPHSPAIPFSIARTIPLPHHGRGRHRAQVRSMMPRSTSWRRFGDGCAGCRPRIAMCGPRWRADGAAEYRCRASLGPHGAKVPAARSNRRTPAATREPQSCGGVAAATTAPVGRRRLSSASFETAQLTRRMRFWFRADDLVLGSRVCLPPPDQGRSQRVFAAAAALICRRPSWAKA
jgi:hypothetical protein